MKQLFLAVAGIYLLLALATKVAERTGIVGCPCPDECWCRRPAFVAVRYIAPIDHTPVADGH